MVGLDFQRSIGRELVRPSDMSDMNGTQYD